MKEYNKDNIPLAKMLRKNMTPWERQLWYEFLRFYRFVFNDKRPSGTILQIFIVQKRG